MSTISPALVAASILLAIFLYVLALIASRV
jgi:hypothetical protein